MARIKQAYKVHTGDSEIFGFDMIKLQNRYQEKKVDANHFKCVLNWLHNLTSFWRAEDAHPRYAGSKARRMLRSPKEDSGKLLKASRRLGL